MDAQELRNLQEAYMEVYELDEGNKKNKQKKNDAVSKIIQKKLHPSVLPSLTYGRRELKKEEVDIYDIILSHLIDEGYAETPEAAEAIMVNMSEEWRNVIVEEILDERNRGERGMLDQEVRMRRDRRDGDTTGGFKPYVRAGGSQRAEHERNRGRKKTKSGYGRTQWQ